MIQQLAKMLGLSRDDAEASMHSDRAARAVLSRRNLFAAGAALATGAAFSFGAAEPEGFWIQNPKLMGPPSWKDVVITINETEWKLGDMPMRIVAVDAINVTRRLAGPFGYDITVAGPDDNAQSWLVEILIGDYQPDAVLNALRAKSKLRGRHDADLAMLCPVCEGA